jgi:hypothetical protein
MKSLACDVFTHDILVNVRNRLLYFFYLYYHERMMSKQIRKYQAIIAMLFIACFFCAFAVKSFHHLEQHDTIGSCETHDSRHLHVSDGKDCLICEFLFSPLHDLTSRIKSGAPYFPNDFVSSLIVLVKAEFIFYHYSLRAPPR